MIPFLPTRNTHYPEMVPYQTTENCKLQKDVITSTTDSSQIPIFFDAFVGSSVKQLLILSLVRVGTNSRKMGQILQKCAFTSFLYFLCRAWCVGHSFTTSPISGFGELPLLARALPVAQSTSHSLTFTIYETEYRMGFTATDHKSRQGFKTIKEKDTDTVEPNRKVHCRGRGGDGSAAGTVG
jgi:hypothetical protein